MSGPRPTVYVIDDDASVRTSLGRLLKVEGFGSEIFPCAEDFLKHALYKRPACLVSDIRMPGLSGLDLQGVCQERGIRIPMVFITGHGEIPMSVEAMKKGAVDFLPKPYDDEALLQAVNQAIEKDRLYLQEHRGRVRVQNRFKTLSPREQQVLRGVISGLLNKQIAIKMGITEKTVKVHRASVMTKMKAASVAHLVRLSEAVGITVSVN